jgi:hypothetical protein
MARGLYTRADNIFLRENTTTTRISTSQALAWLKQAPSEHTIFAYYREQTALNLSRQGYSLEAIAARVPRATPEQLRTWTEPKLPDLKPEIDRYRRGVSKTCAGCGGEIGDNCQFAREFDLYYHAECARKKMYGM